MPGVTVSAPGKLILMGEHAVVYGRPALVAALNLRLTVRVAPRADGAVLLDLPGLGHIEQTSWAELLAYARAARESWDAYSREPALERFHAVQGGDPAHVVKVALGEAAKTLTPDPSPTALPPTGRGEPGWSGPAVLPLLPVGGRAMGEEGRGDEGLGLPGLILRVDSELPIGSGFGSSAATAVAVIAGSLAFRGVPLDLRQIEQLALEVERRQHGLPSGVDSATVLFGGLLWARRLPAGELEIERLAVTSPLLRRLRVYDTGAPAESTGVVVAAVRARRDRDPAAHESLLDRIAAATRGFRAQLQQPAEDATVIVDLIRECHACLQALGVVPEEVSALIRRVEAEGGAGKISGAGALSGPGAGCVLVYHPDTARIAAWPFLQSLSFHAVHLGADGLRRETDA
jgi:mevalonate kinase